jgi:hypothetical protein
MKEKLELIESLNGLLAIVEKNIAKSNPGSEEAELWKGRRAVLQKKLESAWKTVK